MLLFGQSPHWLGMYTAEQVQAAEQVSSWSQVPNVQARSSRPIRPIYRVLLERFYKARVSLMQLLGVCQCLDSASGPDLLIAHLEIVICILFTTLLALLLAAPHTKLPNDGNYCAI